MTLECCTSLLKSWFVTWKTSRIRGAFFFCLERYTSRPSWNCLTNAFMAKLFSKFNFKIVQNPIIPDVQFGHKTWCLIL